VALALVALAACGGPEPGEEDPGGDISATSYALSSIDCTESTDTGYVSGSPFTITVVTVDGKKVETQTANAYYVMAQAAAGAGVNLKVVSGFRTMAQQTYLYNCHVNCNCNNCNLAAKPGYSNHQSGHALDLNTSSSGVLSWLNAHGATYGFKRTVPSESWHWEWWGGGPGGGPCGSCTPSCSGSQITSEDCGVGDCAVYGATCVDDSLGVRCVSVFCPAQGYKKVCVDDKIIGDCNDGAISTGDCSIYGAFCSTTGSPEARCVSVFCASGPDEATTAHDVCLPDGRLAHCTDLGGLTNATECPAGETCVATATGASCQTPAPDSGPIMEPDLGGPEVPPGPSPDSNAPGGSDAGLPPQASPGGSQLTGGCQLGGSGGGTWPMSLLLLLLLVLRRRRR
jgi:MYXO-CTERM domain-containing protein